MQYLLVILVVSAIAYLAWRLLTTPRDGGGGASNPGRREVPRGPDDDPDFLRKI